MFFAYGFVSVSILNISLILYYLSDNLQRILGWIRLYVISFCRESIDCLLQTSVTQISNVERSLFLVYSIIAANWTCCSADHRSGFSCSSVVALLFIPLCIAYTLARFISAGQTRQPLIPTVCRNRNSSCGSCDDVEHRWLTSGRAINRGAVPVIGAGNTAASWLVCPANRQTSAAAVDGRSALRPSALSHRRVRPAPHQLESGSGQANWSTKSVAVVYCVANEIVIVDSTDI